MLPAVNLGLTALYKRFLLKEGLITIDLLPNKYQYTLHSDYAIGSFVSHQNLNTSEQSPQANLRTISRRLSES